MASGQIVARVTCVHCIAIASPEMITHQIFRWHENAKRKRDVMLVAMPHLYTQLGSYSFTKPQIC